MKSFAIAGPIKENKHYFVKNRIDAEHINYLIEQEYYFVLHAPRQTGKTTEISFFVDFLNETGKYKALYVNIESTQAVGSSIEKATLSIFESFWCEIKRIYGSDDPGILFLNKYLEGKMNVYSATFYLFLSHWAEHSDKPIVLFIDEIDSLKGNALLSILRQIRMGYKDRPDYFPQSICLVALHDVRDYRIWSEEKQEYVSGASPFNIKAESLVLQNFTAEQVKDLYTQHTQETGQQFTPDAIAYAFEQTQGQPWLVNALAYQACFRDVTDRMVTITKQIMERARETLILRRDTHLDALLEKLHEPRISVIVDDSIQGDSSPKDFRQDDVQ